MNSQLQVLSTVGIAIDNMTSIARRIQSMRRLDGIQTPLPGRMEEYISVALNFYKEYLRQNFDHNMPRPSLFP